MRHGNWSLRGKGKVIRINFIVHFIEKAPPSSCYRNKMQLTVKTLKGEKFVVNAEPTNTVADVKTIIVSI